MVLCPMTKEECEIECAWFQEEECAVARLHDLVDSLDDVKEAVYTLEETIRKTDFIG
ncbi:hypothetical protein AALC16_23700 [Lachnospiraceae bacterium 29-91]|jgi:hypothetical protein|nr:hypothetical protein [uncultured Schaedlerella sp.]EOS39744.1 hypothetical protein C808_01550 [Lachnospiraceae bacterium M18-1]MCI9154131.1 hypothetical protein [Ruminococcus sp.]